MQLRVEVRKERAVRAVKKRRSFLGGIGEGCRDGNHFRQPEDGRYTLLRNVMSLLAQVLLDATLTKGV